MKRVLILAFCALLFAPNFALVKAQTTPPTLSDVEKYITQLMPLYDVPGAAIALVKDGKVIFTKGFGVRNTQSQTPVDENTMFAIGSVTKSFTTLDAMTLVNAGKLDLDEPIISYVPDFKVSDAAISRTLTMRQLLSQTSGLPPVSPADQSPVIAKTTPAAMLTQIAEMPLNVPPGKLFQYTNQNFELAGDVVSKISGVSWQAYTQAHIFDALQMKSSGFDEASLKRTGNYAEPHMYDALQGAQPVPFMSVTGVEAAGAVVSNATDLANYLLFQLGDGAQAGQTLLTRDQVTAMHMPQIDIVPPMTTGSSPKESYGLGWFVDSYRDKTMVHHGGNIVGFSAELAMLPDQNAGLVILTNTHGALSFMEFARDYLLDYLLGQPPDTALMQHLLQTMGDPQQLKQLREAGRTFKAAPKLLESYTGHYNNGASAVEVTTHDGKLYVSQAGVEYEYVPTRYVSDTKSLIAAANTVPIKGVSAVFRADDAAFTRIYVAGLGYAIRVNDPSKVYRVTRDWFTIDVPAGDVALTNLTLLNVFSPADKNPTIVVCAQSPKGDLETGARALLAGGIPALNPAVGLTASDTGDAASGSAWRRFTYRLPSNQAVMLLAEQVKDVTCGMAIVTSDTPDAIQKAQAQLVELTTTITPGKNP